MARSFPGTNDVIAWSGGPLLYNQSSATVAFWFNKPQMTAAGGGVFVLDVQSAFNRRVSGFMGDGTSGSVLGKWQFSWRTPGGGIATASSANRWDDGLWHRAGLVRRPSGNLVELYIDAASEGTSATDPGVDATAAAGQWWGNNFQGGGGASFAVNGGGSLGRLAVWAGIVLSPAEIDLFLFRGICRVPPSQWLELGVGAATLESDRSINHLDGALTGTRIERDGPWMRPQVRQLRAKQILFFLSPSGSLSSSGALTKQAQLAKAGAIASSGALTRAIAKPLAGAITPAGALAKAIAKPLAGTISSSGVVALIKVLLRSFAGTITSSGALKNQPQKGLAGAVSSAGAMTRAVSKALVGALAPAGALAKSIAKKLAGAIASSGVASLFSAVLGILFPQATFTPDSVEATFAIDSVEASFTSDATETTFTPDLFQ
jgi:hypothetical protein